VQISTTAECAGNGLALHWERINFFQFATGEKKRRRKRRDGEAIKHGKESGRRAGSLCGRCTGYLLIEVRAKNPLSPPMLDLTSSGVAGGTAGSGAPTRVMA
jgi:hypothetical protein